MKIIKEALSLLLLIEAVSYTAAEKASIRYNDINKDINEEYNEKLDAIKEEAKIKMAAVKEELNIKMNALKEEGEIEMKSTIDKTEPRSQSDIGPPPFDSAKGTPYDFDFEENEDDEGEMYYYDYDEDDDGVYSENYKLDDIDTKISNESYEENIEEEVDYINLTEEDADDNTIMMMERDPNGMEMLGGAEEMVLGKMKLRSVDINNYKLLDETVAENDPEEIIMESDPIEMMMGSNAEELALKKINIRSIGSNHYELDGTKNEVLDEYYADTENNEMMMENDPAEMMTESDPRKKMMESNPKENNIGKRRLRGAVHNDYKLDYLDKDSADYENDKGLEEIEEIDISDILSRRSLRSNPTMKMMITHEKDGIPNQWIVTMKEQTGISAFTANDLENLAYQVAEETRSKINVLMTYTDVVQGFTVSGVSKEAAKKYLKDPRVEMVEQDGIVNIDSVTWGLDRIDERDLPLDRNYVPFSGRNGHGITAYIIDTGILLTHSEFQGRARFGTNTIDNVNEDCNGHGTHVAGTVGGRNYGVAKMVNLVSVKVLNCHGSGTWSSVIRGVDWVGSDARNKKATANLSLGGGGSTSLDQAVTNLHNSGVVTVVAAGNSRADACRYSPARATKVITVGATANNDSRASFSNYGSCVDIFAPGQSITSAWIGSNTQLKTISGTSMAAPHVCGAAALHLQGGASAGSVEASIKNAATRNKVGNAGSGSLNLLLYVGPQNHWDQINGRLKWASVSENGQHVWGVNSADYIYYCNGANSNWVNIPGRLKQVSVSADGQHVWGVNSYDQIFYRNGVSSSWVNIVGRLKRVSVSADGLHVWGVNSADYIYYRNGVNSNWVNIPGRLKQVSVSADGQHVWGVNSYDQIFYRNGVSSSWVNIAGRLKQVSVSADGQDVWGVNYKDQIFYRNGVNRNWVNIAGRLKQVSVSADGGHVWGVNSGDYIYKRN